MNEAKNCETPATPDGDISVSEILASLPVSKEFEALCEDAARMAFSIEKLHREQARRGFLAISIRSYLERLTSYTQVELAPLLKRFGLSDLEVSSTNASGLGGFLRQIGFSVAEAIALVRISFCEQQGLKMLAASISYRSRSGAETDELAGATASLDELEQSYSPQSREAIGRILDLIESEFQPE